MATSKPRELKNGATVLRSSGTSGRIVLAKYNGEFVTWTVDHEGFCCWGHYHGTDKKAADADFEIRVANVVT